MVDRNRTGTTLLMASTGGHLEQLLRLRDRIQPTVEPVEWVTFDDPQSQSLLAGEVVHHVPYVAPRNFKAVLANVPAAHRILSHGDYARIVTTGSAIVLSFLPIARARGMSCHFIESSARAQGPSVTGSIVSHIPGMHLYTQYPSWAGERWTCGGSLFDVYGPRPRPGGSLSQAKRVVVTLGTMRTYGFRRAAEAVAALLPAVLAPQAEVLWQTGVTDVTGLDIDGQESVTAAEMRAAVKEADLVIAHAGVGSALTALDLGKMPVLLPRLKTRYNEMVDDHQLMIAAELDSRGVAVSRDPGALSVDDLRWAMNHTVVTAQDRTPFLLSR
ncbi:MAG: glycosyl transferase family 28 [Actinomycetota bacterium]|nr:glycosyl transferase family 28 [Actinomycetota bacterium]